VPASKVPVVSNGPLSHPRPAVEPGVANYCICPIPFSNGSRTAARCERNGRLSGVCVLYVLIWHLMGFSWVQSGSVEVAVGETGRALRNRRRHLLPPLGVAPLGRLGSISSSAQTARLCRYELGAVPQHRMHDDGETTGERYFGLVHCRSFGDREGSIFELQRPLVAAQHDVCRLVEKCTNASIAALRDAAGVINLA
jgi:hypothetical protein